VPDVSGKTADAREADRCGVLAAGQPGSKLANNAKAN